LRLFGVSKFVTWKARTEGVGSALAKQILPPFKFIDSVTKDIVSAGDEKGLEIVKSIPIIGKLAYWHIGRGSEKRMDLWEFRLSNKKKKLKKIKERVERNPSERKKYKKELKQYAFLMKFQYTLNKQKSRINKLKAIDKKRDVSDRIDRLETKRAEMIEKLYNKL